MAFGFNDDKSKYALYSEPQVKATLLCGSSESANDFWSRFKTAINSLYSEYGENLKIRVNLSSVVVILRCSHYIKNPDIVGLHYNGGFENNILNNGSQSSWNRYTYIVNFAGSNTNPSAFAELEEYIEIPSGSTGTPTYTAKVKLFGTDLTKLRSTTFELIV